MEIAQLKNYGRGVAEIVTDQQATSRLQSAVMSEAPKELGFMATAKLAMRLPGEVGRVRGQDWSALTARGINNRLFLDRAIESMVAVRSASQLVGIKAAAGIYLRIWDKIGVELAENVFPKAAEFQACNDPSDSFKQYVKAFNTANVSSGISEIAVVEDSGSALAWNVKYCAWHDVASRLGDPYLCYPSTCYAEEVLLPFIGLQVGWRFSREGTLATGAPACTFCFERRTAPTP